LITSTVTALRLCIPDVVRFIPFEVDGNFFFIRLTAAATLVVDIIFPSGSSDFNPVGVGILNLVKNDLGWPLAVGFAVTTC
jgi:hypothetical protein